MKLKPVYSGAPPSTKAHQEDAAHVAQNPNEAHPGGSGMDHLQVPRVFHDSLMDGINVLSDCRVPLEMKPCWHEEQE